MNSSSTRGRAGGLTVQQSFPRPRPTTNPYLRQLADAIGSQPGVRVLPFSWRSALLGRYDVFHVHWPEILVTGASPAKTLVRQLLTLLLVARLAVLRRPIVRTLHNLTPWEGLDGRRAALVRLIERRTALVVLLNDLTPVPARTLSALVPHGHYRDWYDTSAAPGEGEPGRAAFVGLIRPYKGVESLVEVFRSVPGEVSLAVAGKPASPELASRLQELASGDPRVELDLRYLDDVDLVAAVRRARLVVLPHRGMHNSGSALAALSLDRPVLVPANEVNERLAREVGEQWVRQYDGDLDAADIAAALSAAEGIAAGERPDLSNREWPAAGRAHVEAYRTAIARARGRRQ